MNITQASIDNLFPATIVAGGAYDEATSTSVVKASVPGGAELRRILGLSVPVAIVLAEREMPVETLLDLKVGSIIEFDVPFDSELTFVVANQAIGYGQAVKVGENFGIRVSELGTVRSRIAALGGG